jgi:hypothetical protein
MHLCRIPITKEVLTGKNEGESQNWVISFLQKFSVNLSFGEGFIFSCLFFAKKFILSILTSDFYFLLSCLMNKTTATLLAKLHLTGNEKKNQTTKLFKSSDNFFNAKAILLPLTDKNKLNVIVNESQALAFGITAEDIITLKNSRGEVIVVDVTVSSEIKSGTI